MIESASNLIRYDGDGITDEFDYPFLVFQASDLKVYVDGSLVSNSAYTVSGLGVESGGEVTFTTPPGVGLGNVILEREAEFTQPTSIPEGSKFPARVVETAHDRQTMLAQQLDSRVRRCIQLDITSYTSSDSMVLAANATERAAKIIGFNSTGTGLALAEGGGAAEAEIWAQAAANSAAEALQSANDASNSLTELEVLIDGLQDQINAAISGFVTGDVKMTWRPSPTTGWVFMDDGTIGSGDSGGTTRANADTEDLYTLFWENFADELIPVTGGRGADAATDFAADKPLRLPRVVGRALYAAGQGSTVAVGGDSAVNTTLNTLTVRSNVDTWITGMPVTFTLSSGTITGLTSGTVYYIIRATATAVQLASTRLNAQNGTAINLTAKSSPVWTIQHVYENRETGGFFGEQSHAPKSTEVAPHAHSHSHTVPFTGTFGGATNALSVPGLGTRQGFIGTTVSAVVTGGGVTQPVTPPGVACNIAVKL
jgi:hypothetical protein